MRTIEDIQRDHDAFLEWNKHRPRTLRESEKHLRLKPREASWTDVGYLLKELADLIHDHERQANALTETVNENERLRKLRTGGTSDA